MSSEVQKSKIHESVLENGEIKLILYRERKRQLEEELRRRLHREAIYQELIRSEYLTLQSPYRTRAIEPDYSPQLASRSLDRRFYRMNAPSSSGIEARY
ncbi:Oidioi.mRNA.OKI2018_I69.chr1.g1632.t1.cds [Oikopleura dioica]|uniref:Oidioi.mRNA.OKI2018_I69.chr1.g1632.t1.cds n=1 Tax=Oikopleura dioica TaxID=34765 RepID=A0ABN7SSR0_OIKDI|nr:Oidioi.mRNA.OKI2018_I69.chr1.g1632.t1.cds [Oikopleura dioica]